MTVTKDTVLTVAPEIIDTTLIAASDFGADSFVLNYVPTQNLLIAPFSYDSTLAAMAYTGASLTITNNGQTIYSGDLQAKMNKIIVPTLTTDYTMTVIKAGYQTIIQTLSATQILEYVNTPLDIYLVTSSAEYSLVNNVVSGDIYVITECVRDNITGLVWEGKPTSGTRASINTYTNWGDGRTSDTSSYLASVNSIKLCGYNDWCMPSSLELMSLVDTTYNPKINPVWFPNTLYTSTPNGIGFVYWTSTSSGATGYYEVADFFYGIHYNGAGYPGNNNLIRLVRPSN
jgi:hypothetical protein